jgi:hypothetical protein
MQICSEGSTGPAVIPSIGADFQRRLGWIDLRTASSIDASWSVGLSAHNTFRQQSYWMVVFNIGMASSASKMM